MKQRVIESKVIHTDDPPVTACTPGEKGTHRSRFRVYLGGAAHPCTVNDCTPSRKRDGPAAFLEGFFGSQKHPSSLQADAFGGYDGIYAAGAENSDDHAILEVTCWAQARRKFYDARRDCRRGSRLHP